jgi:hypothetical protein
MRGLIASAALIGLLATACSETGAQSLGPAPSDEPTVSPSQSDVPTTSPSQSDEPTTSPSPSVEPTTQGGTHASRILVESPGVGERVSSPVTISGRTADVFQDVVSVRILDGNGDTIASYFTVATCDEDEREPTSQVGGTRCHRGTYSMDVRYQVLATQSGTIRVYTSGVPCCGPSSSAVDGGPYSVDIPVTLTA